MTHVLTNKEIKKRKISFLTKINTTFFFVSILFSIFAEKFNKHMISKKEKWKNWTKKDRKEAKRTGRPDNWVFFTGKICYT